MTYQPGVYMPLRALFLVVRNEGQQNIFSDFLKPFWNLGHMTVLGRVNFIF